MGCSIPGVFEAMQCCMAVRNVERASRLLGVLGLVSEASKKVYARHVRSEHW